MVLALLLMALLAIVGGLYWSLHRAQSGTSRTVMVHVAAGESVTDLAEALHAKGIVSNALLFRLDARLHSLGGKLKVGDYPLRGNMSIDDVVNTMAIYHPVDQVKITIPEGLRIEQIADILTRHKINGAQFLQLAKHPTFTVPILASKPVGASLEGYLFPDTYDVPPHFSAKDLILVMLHQLDKKLTPAMRAEGRKEGFNVFQTLTMASIVQREDRMTSEAPLIAAVYINRLHMNPAMPLQADPTVQFPLGTPKNWWPVLTRDQLHSTVSSYNTYEHTGLPPGPIANPGLTAIQGVLKPARTHYLYFVAKGNTGYHAFATTYDQQLANEAKYQHP